MIRLTASKQTRASQFGVKKKLNGWIISHLSPSRSNSEREKHRAIVSQEFMVGRHKRQTVRSDEEATMLGQSCETGDLGEDGRRAVQSHPRTDVGRPIFW